MTTAPDACSGASASRGFPTCAATSEPLRHLSQRPPTGAATSPESRSSALLDNTCCLTIHTASVAYSGVGELRGDALSLLQNRVEVLCLNELVGLQVLERPGAAHGQAGRSGRPGIGEVHDDEPVVLAEHQVVRLKPASHGLDRPGHYRYPVARPLHGRDDRLGLEGEEHRVLRHSGLPLPPAHRRTPRTGRSLKAITQGCTDKGARLNRRVL